MFTSNEDYGTEMSSNIFYSPTVWQEWGLDKFISPFPQCLMKDNWPINNGTMTRVLGDSLIYGPFWNGYGGGLFMPDNLPQFVECNLNFMSMDQANPTLVRSGVWSWAEGEPKVQPNYCPSIGPNGRWYMQSCDYSLAFVCRNVKNVMDYTISTTVGAWGQPSCPSGYSFSVPTNGFYNSQLKVKANGSSLWIAKAP